MSDRMVGEKERVVGCYLSTSMSGGDCPGFLQVVTSCLPSQRTARLSCFDCLADIFSSSGAAACCPRPNCIAC